MTDRPGDTNPRVQVGVSTTPEFARTLRQTASGHDMRLSSLVVAALTYVLDHPQVLKQVVLAGKAIDQEQTAIRIASRWPKRPRNKH
ncbi:MAG: hypothetical protein M3063_07455 [Actinomycetota bacterium]|nr:hypothetical protein [Actinomycetota bacterium]